MQNIGMSISATTTCVSTHTQTHPSTPGTRRTRTHADRRAPRGVPPREMHSNASISRPVCGRLVVSTIPADARHSRAYRTEPWKPIGVVDQCLNAGAQHGHHGNHPPRVSSCALLTSLRLYCPCHSDRCVSFHAERGEGRSTPSTQRPNQRQETRSPSPRCAQTTNPACVC